MALALENNAPLSIPPTPRVNRRRLAAAIRVRQELQKRATRWLPTPQWQGFDSARTVLSSVVTQKIDNGESLLSVARAQTKWPLPKPLDGGPSDADEVIRQADRVLRGEWTVFQHAVRFEGASIPWRQHPISGVTTPLSHFSQMRYIGEELGGDVKYIWELNRHAELLRLAQAYHLTRTPAYAERAVDLLMDWIDANPPMRGINWVSALEISFRSIVWCWIWQLTASSSAWSDERAAKFLWVQGHAGRCIQRYDSIHHSPNTHLTGEALGLLYIGSTFPQLRDAGRFRKRGIEILISEIPHQFLADGMHFERSTGYHRYHIEFYLHALAIAQAAREAWAAAIAEPLARSLEASMATRLPDGNWPVLGDEDGGATMRLWSSLSNSHEPLLTLGAHLLNRPDFAAGTAAHRGALSWWFGNNGVDSDVAAAKPSSALRDAGYYVCRDTIGGADWFCLVDAGPHGGRSTGHAHTDLGHIELFVGQKPVLADPGCAVYASDNARRDFYRSLGAHACVQVDGNPLGVTRGTFGWSSVAPTPKVELYDSEELWACWLSYDVLGASTISHERFVVHVRGVGLVVLDRLAGVGEHDLQWHWPFAHEVDATALSVPAQSMIVAGVRSAWVASAAVTSHVVPSIRSVTYGHEMPVSALDVLVKGISLPFSMVTTFVPEQRGAWQVTPETEKLLNSTASPMEGAEPSPDQLAVAAHRIASATFGPLFTSRVLEH